MARVIRHTDAALVPLALALTVAASLPCAATRLGAQRATRPSSVRDTTLDARARADIERRLEQARRELERTLEALQGSREALRADTTGEKWEEYTRLEAEALRARRSYDATIAAMLRLNLERSRAEAEAAVQSLRASLQGAPRGWLGASLTMQYTIERDSGKEIMLFQDYPIVESVEPNSPAERAGLEARDRLVALNGRDLRDGTEPFTKLLEPGARLGMRVRRGRATRDLTVVVGKRPEGEWGVGNVVIARSAAPLRVAVPPLPPVPPLSVMTPDVVQLELGGVGMESGSIAGAQVQRVGDLRDYFGVQDGLLVLRIVPGTVAERSGLRGGDVILQAGNDRITTPLTLRRAMDRSGDQRVKLEIVRKGKKESVVLRWDR